MSRNNCLNKSTNSSVTNKKAGKGNGHSVIDNHEYGKNQTSDYVSGDTAPSSSGHNFSRNSR